MRKAIILGEIETQKPVCTEDIGDNDLITMFILAISYQQKQCFLIDVLLLKDWFIRIICHARGNPVTMWLAVLDCKCLA